MLADAVGPWSATASFMSPSGGYISGSELYDPLINDMTVGQIHGSVTFLPGVGVRLNDFTSYISYELPQPLASGKLSLLMTNIVMETPGLKTKVFSMSSGYDDITTNSRRFTVEKRGEKEAGDIAWRVIGSNGAIETIGNERRKVNFNPSNTYFWRATWDSALTPSSSDRRRPGSAPWRRRHPASSFVRCGCPTAPARRLRTDSVLSSGNELIRGSIEFHLARMRRLGQPIRPPVMSAEYIEAKDG